ncbi:MAG TPA: RNA-binding S4 domain-containing protein [Acidobacteriaceae bacterium]
MADSRTAAQDPGLVNGRPAVRMDKWLWAARFFKTRALAVKACELGRVHSNQIQAKAARDVHVGDRLHIKTEGGEFDIDVVSLSEMRGPAAVAQTLYQETDESKRKRAELAAAQKALNQLDMAPVAKPSKRDRRLIDRFRGRR